MTGQNAAPEAVGAGPVPSGERIATVDVVRGVALLGILLVNMAFFSSPVFNDQAAGIVRFDAPYDRAAAWLIRFLAEGKFYTLFSFLFGLGLFLQMTRAEARGVRFVPLYIRRLLVLLGIGLLHAWLLWYGDILVTYALLGFPLLLFRNRQPRTLVIWAVVLIALPVAFIGLATVAVSAAQSNPQSAAELERSVRAGVEINARQAAEAVENYARGGFAGVMAQRVRDNLFYYSVALFIFPSVFAMFLLGVAAGRAGIVQDPAGHLPLFRRVFAWGLPLGLLGNLLYATLSEGSSRFVPTVGTFVAQAGQSLGAPVLALAYGAGLTLLMQRPGWAARLAPVGAVGRMALSNYLTQSLVCTTVFYSYGLGLYGQVGPAAGILLALAIYLIQIPLSVWWLSRYRFGPVEWVWRTLTYGRAQPMRLARDGATGAPSGRDGRGGKGESGWETSTRAG